jgi:hypothetical protein
VIASELRALGACGSFDRLFDLLSQFVSRVTSYRWLAVSAASLLRVGIHSNPKSRDTALAEAKASLSLGDDVSLCHVEDGDAHDDERGPAPIVRPIVLGGVFLGHIALSMRAP